MSLVLKQVSYIGGSTLPTIEMVPLEIVSVNKELQIVVLRTISGSFGEPMIIKILINSKYDNEYYFDVILICIEDGQPNSSHKLLSERELLDELGIDSKIILSF